MASRRDRVVIALVGCVLRLAGPEYRESFLRAYQRGQRAKAPAPKVSPRWSGEQHGE